MPSDPLFGPTLTTPAMAAAVSGEAWLRAMLSVEAALAGAEAAAGVIPAEAADAIATACASASLDLERIGRDAAASASPVVPLVRELTAVVPDFASRYVHWGATTQDVMDTAMALVARSAIDLLLVELDGLASACAALASRHRDTLMPGRTLLQQALPITFGLKAAGWLEAAGEARDRLVEVRDRRLAVQLGGASGTLASLGERGLDVVRELALRLSLPEPVLPWHTARARVVELGAALVIASGTAAKIALDIALLMQTEVGEAFEGAPGGSSALPQKRNPVASIEAQACARAVEAQLVVLAGAMRAEHERAAGALQAEWPALTETFLSAGGAVARARAALSGLRVDAERMRANLDLTRGLLMSESVAMALAAKVGREPAQALVKAAAERVTGGGITLRQALLADAKVMSCLGVEEIDAALDPAGYLGSAPAFIERALAAHQRRLGGI